ncbi:HWE histidine kinase domain-containing protein [Tropicibacter naphthalenivorans]|uniref:histidine kinase n=1 Tax=Tropicibacter naphthalenivorans TaxID=441103 RepID=A0A0P1GGZ5_9RHOB|nr:HWE histidine kinase domain-containing protein [Tropicibacter naphthalenivorans]CUH75592.1 Bacteriophytochrome [Tropicibacter naphthalenivorans]SMC43320.1 Bacteriophytochrome (light-regulated signal transduction histidine kinase) [Tropicibacter naphthalenivorans]
MNTHTPSDTPKVDLTNCDREPIHQLGRVQSYGALVAVSSDWIVQHASENLGAILGTDHAEAVGRPLSELIYSDSFDRIRENLPTLDVEDGALRLFNVALNAGERTFDVSLHRSGRHILIEFEPKAARASTDVMTEVYPHIKRISGKGDLTRLARDAARGLRALSGFDSVMVYQFQPDASGKVIAEDRLDRTPHYMGMMFPASDIPVQARALYKRSLLRLISDVDDGGAAILPATTLDRQPLDLSLAVTRAVSPIHIEYLRNMGVKASMSVSIMKDGELWGLFACHNHTPRYIDYERRTAIEMFAHLFSYELSRFEDAERDKASRDMNRLQTQLMAYMADGRDIASSLLSVSEQIHAVIPHDGMILYSDEEFFSTGSSPTQEEFMGIANMLNRSIDSGIYATQCLTADHPPAAAFVDRCAGVLAIPVARRPRDYLLLCRRQVIETVNWAGNPEKPVAVGPNGTRLTPRKSFDAWSHTVEGQCAAWSPYTMHAAELMRTVLLEVFLKVTDATNQERKRAQEQQQLLISELNHRVRNILNLMRGLISQSKSSAGSLREFTENLDGRIHALARAHDQLTAEKWEPSSLRTLIECEFEAYAVTKSSRVRINGNDVMITPQAYTTMALVLHEMATNSIKYGALCDSTGHVDVFLERDANDALLLTWIERNGPPVQPPTRRGFGTVIIEKSVPYELRGDADVNYKITGLEATFRIPAKYITEAKAPDPAVLPKDDSGPAQPGNAASLSGPALVLEDTMIIALDAAACLEDLGASPVKICSSVGEALEAIDKTVFSFALLDVNLGDEQSVPVAQKLAEQGVPFALATGYGETEDIVRVFPPCVIIQKPFSDAALQNAISATLG